MVHRNVNLDFFKSTQVRQTIFCLLRQLFCCGKPRNVPQTLVDFSGATFCTLLRLNDGPFNEENRNKRRNVFKKKMIKYD